MTDQELMKLDVEIERNLKFRNAGLRLFEDAYGFPYSEAVEGTENDTLMTELMMTEEWSALWDSYFGRRGETK